MDRHIGIKSYLAIARFFFSPAIINHVNIFDSKLQAQKLEEDIRKSLDTSGDIGKKFLAIVLIGNDPSSEKFIQIKVSLCEKLCIPCKVFKIDEKENLDEEIISQVEEIFKNDDVAGGIVQLPLPRKSLEKLLNVIPFEKDVDVISTEGKKRFYSGDFSKLSPVIRAFENFLSNCGISYKGLKAVVIGEGDLVGKPISFYLSKKGAEVKTISDYKSGDRLDCKISVLATGIPNLVKGEDISEGCNVVDFGSSVLDGKCVGDLDMDSSIDHLGIISKSPGGMGPLVVRYLLLNFLNQ